MNLRLLPWIAAAVLSCEHARSQDFFATNVPGANNWLRAGQAQGAPANNNCNTAGATPDYATNTGGTAWLVATDMQGIGIPGGQAIDTVQVGVLCRYDMNEAGTFRFQAQWNGNTVGQDWTINNGSGDCRWRTIDLTFSEPDFWSQAELNALQLRIRRVNTNNNNDLRVKAFRIRITLGPDCNGNGIPDPRDLAMGAPDCNGNGILDSCELMFNDCNQNGVPDECDLASGLLTDCNGNGRPDQCSGDCNNNGVPDDIDICNGQSSCNNYDLDSCEIANGAEDCNANGIPDHCEYPDIEPRYDVVSVPFGQSTARNIALNDVNFDPFLVRVDPVDTNPIGGPQYGTIFPGTQPGFMDFISSNSPGDCGTTYFRYRLRSLDSCSANYVTDDVEIEVTFTAAPNDCNNNCVDDTLEISQGLLTDCDGDGIPTICPGEVEDCNGNGIPDCTDIANMTVSDVNQNGVPDPCEDFELNYCQPTVNSAGCASVMGHFGVASLQASTLVVFTANVLHPNFGLLLWSRTETSVPLGGGTLCLGNPIRRTPIIPTAQSPEPAPCDGLLVFRWTTNELMSHSFQPGDQVYCQFWSRDVAAPGGLNLTDGIEFTVLP